MTIAVNDAGDVLTLDGGAWKPAMRAVHEDTGQTIVLDGKNWVPLPSRQSTEAPLPFETATNVPTTTEKPEQGTAGALLNAAARGVTSGVGGAIAGAGEFGQNAGSAARTIKALDSGDMSSLDRGEQRVARLYREASPEQKDTMLSVLEQQSGGSNPVTEAGKSVQEFGKRAFPIAPENEGFGTKVAGVVGGALPIMAGFAINPIAGFAVAASQAYDSVFNDATAKGATPEEAEKAAGRTALAQGAAMVTPVGRILQRIPMDLRDEFGRALIGLAQSGVETGAGNALATLAGNFIASHSYDPSRSLLEGVGEAFATGAAGGPIVHGIAGAAQGVMGAKNVDQAIQAANDAAGTGPDVEGNIARVQAQIGASPPPPPIPDATLASSFVPPGSNIPGNVQLASMATVNRQALANRPSQLPPGAALDPLTGESTPIQEPRLGRAEQTVPSWGDLFAQGRVQAPEETPAAATSRTSGGGPFVPGSAGVPVSAGSAASREGTPTNQIVMSPQEAASSRFQGEVERLATPPRQNDATIYIPGTKPTLAETTGDPRAAIDQKYNRQQPEAMQAHIEQENRNADLVSDYFADTAGSKPTLDRMEEARDTRAKQNIQQVFGDPQSERAPADLTPTVEFMQGITSNPRQAERDAVVKTLSKLEDKFYNADGELKTDPYALYGIGEHINDLLRGVGDTESSSAARVLKRELVQIKESLYDDIEKAAPGFAQYRVDYQQDSAAIDAMKLLQDERLSLLNKDQHITPAKWFRFMQSVVEGRSDPMDPASKLSEDQMDRLWNITDQLKRSTFIDAGSPRGSPTSMLQEWGKRFGVAAAHIGALHFAPVVGNVGIQMGQAMLRKRSVTNEMNRVLNPDLGQQGP